MRELRLHPSKKRKPYEVVRRLEFGANGGEFVAWVGAEVSGETGRSGHTNVLHICNYTSNSVRVMIELGWWEWDWFDRTADPVVSPDRKLLVYEYNSPGEAGTIDFTELGDPPWEPLLGRHPPSCSHGMGALVFTPEGKELLAVRNLEVKGTFAPDVVRFEMASLFRPPIRFEEKINPLTQTKYKKAIYDIRWRTCMALQRGERIVSGSLSTDGRFLAVGGEKGGAHVADLKKKTVVASFPWEGRAVRDRAVMRVAFDPFAERVVMLANGRLFARPLGQGNAWQTKSTLGYAHDFAFHPSGNVLCAVFTDGQARYLDARTGAVKQSFRWSKKSKPLYSVAFAPDGLTCTAGGENGRVVIWDVDL